MGKKKIDSGVTDSWGQKRQIKDRAELYLGQKSWIRQIERQIDGEMCQIKDGSRE